MSHKLIDWLQKYKRNSAVYQTLLNAIAPEMDTLNDKLFDFVKQLSVETATWGLAIYEAELDVPINNTNKPLAERRSVIMARLRGSGKLGAKEIKLIADSWTNGDVDVSFDGTKIGIKFNSVTGIPPNLEDLKKALEEAKPAHLGLFYMFAYLLINEIEGVMTLEHLERMPLNKFAGG